MRGVNARLRAWMLDRLAEGRGMRAIVPVDFYKDDDVVDVMLGFNLVSLRAGEERWRVVPGMVRADALGREKDERGASLGSRQKVT